MKIAMVGDIGLFGRHRLSFGRANAFFAEVAEYLAQFDMVIGNLETPFTAVTRTGGSKSAYIRSEPENVELLKTLNISAVSLANNHVLDFGNAGLIETIHTLEKAGIAHYGIQGRTHDFSCGGQRVRLIGMCSYDTNPLGVLSGRINEFSIAATERALAQSAEESAFPILSIHFGIEHRSYPMPRHVAAFRDLASRHEFILHGHHPHAVQPVEEVGGALLAYSLGNFCFDAVYDPKTGEEFLGLSDIARIGAILTVELTPEGRRWGLVPLRDDGARLIVEDQQASRFLADIQTRFAADEAACQAYAQAQRTAFVVGRKSRRDWRFWLQRFRPRYFRMVGAGMLNALLDRRAVPF